MDPRFGGLSAVVPQLSAAVAAATGEKVGLAAFCSPGELFAPPANPQISFSEWPASRAAWWKDASLRKSFAQCVRSVEGVHVHGIWEESTRIACQIAEQEGVPYVVSAHGMLERWALANKRLKKWIYSVLVERGNLQGAACLHALTRAEADDYRRFGCTAPIAVIPNGVRLPERITPDLFLGQNPELRGKRIVLFLGRIHFKKGLDILVGAWEAVHRAHPDAHLVLAGPDFEGTRLKIQTLITEKRLDESVLMPGMLRDELKWSALAAAESFVLPSYSEGLSVSVLEAMGMGLPVIVSEACNLPEVALLGAGKVIAAEQRPLQDALDQLLSSSAEANRSIGARGKTFVRERFAWPVVAGQMASVYGWVRGGARPVDMEIFESPGRSGRA